MKKITIGIIATVLLASSVIYATSSGKECCSKKEACCAKKDAACCKK